MVPKVVRVQITPTPISSLCLLPPTTVLLLWTKCCSMYERSEIRSILLLPLLNPLTIWSLRLPLPRKGDRTTINNIAATIALSADLVPTITICFLKMAATLAMNFDRYYIIIYYYFSCDYFLIYFIGILFYFLFVTFLLNF